MTLNICCYFISYLIKALLLECLLLIPLQSSASLTPKTNQDMFRLSITSTQRRLAQVCFIGFSSLKVSPSSALTTPKATDIGYLKRRVDSFDTDQYRPGIQDDDVYYPEWLNGKWKSASKFVAFDYPLQKSFGGQPKNATEKELGSVLEYICRFKPVSSTNVAHIGSCISDRLYNVEQIALASIGPNSILEDSQESSNTANSLRLLIRPPQVSTLYDISLECTDRQIFSRNKNSFDVLERTTQTIIVQTEFRGQRLVKDIETITCYQLLEPGKVFASQRTATFLTPNDPRYASAAAQDDRVSTSAIDIRKFEVLYAKVV
jgi:hypothetical protein